MIVTRTPFRITLGGGGTDLPSFYEKHGGYILASAMDKYMYVTLNVPFADRLVRLHYTQSETVENAAELKHELAREALLGHGITHSVEIASLADLPAGTGLGSSSSYLVGLLNAIRAYLEIPTGAADLAMEACDIELNRLKKPIGKQDQYMAAFGGLTELRISRNGKVDVERLALPPYAAAEFIARTHLYYTNIRRDATEILAHQDNAVKSATTENRFVESALLEIKQIGEEIGTAFRRQDFDRFGTLMHDHWLAKKSISAGITVDPMERLYDHLRDSYGVTGGKVAGAGGGGFMMLYCPGDGARLTEFMKSRGFDRLSWALDYSGSRVASNMLASGERRQHSAPPLATV